ncbi:hypothetical protein SAMN05192588_0669 [Nonlabens sp. Hel1_33_55]|nr:hypothetical protein SAMN05192588_0669 [Nonlabens sp. Hel1_33_55]
MKLKKTFIYTLLILLSSACVTRKELPNLIPPKNAITVTHHRNIIGGFERPVIVETWNDFNPKKNLSEKL